MASTYYKGISKSATPSGLLRFAFYAFIFSIPFEVVSKDIGLGSGSFTISKFIGYIFFLIALSNYQLFIKKFPNALFGLAIYFYVLIGFAFWEEMNIPRGYTFSILFTRVQLLILFWFTYNLLRNSDIAHGALLALVLSCSILSILLISDIAVSVHKGRITAGQTNPNLLGWTLALGLLSLVGLAYQTNRTVGQGKLRVLAWACFGFLVMALVGTGSRGSILGLFTGFLVFLIHGSTKNSRIKTKVFILMGIGLIAFTVMQSEVMLERMEKTIEHGNVGGRDLIFSKAWEMFLEKPVMGWGVIQHGYELGARVGKPRRDTHNLYLTVLLETGLLGAIPFMGCLWMCGRAAWLGRAGSEGVLPLALLVCTLIVNLKGTYIHYKLFWIVLAYAVANPKFNPNFRLSKNPSHRGQKKILGPSISQQRLS